MTPDGGAASGGPTSRSGLRSPQGGNLAALRVPTRGFTIREWALQAVVLGFGLLFTIMLYSAGDLGAPVPVLDQVAAVLVLVLVLELLFLRVWLRAIVVEPNSVTFLFPFRAKQVPWEDLRLEDPTRSMGLLWLGSPNTSAFGVPGRRFYGVTLEQTRALAEHPACPSDLRGRLRSGLEP